MFGYIDIVLPTPSIDKCYKRGALDPGHTRDACPNRLCCLCCGYQGHAFFECNLNPNISPSQYSEYHKEQAYCIACQSASGHCSLNHCVCPTKKNIIRSRILGIREKGVHKKLSMKFPDKTWLSLTKFS